MDVAGVGLATVISQVIAAILVILILVRETDDFKLNLKKTMLLSAMTVLLGAGISTFAQEAQDTEKKNFELKINSTGEGVLPRQFAPCS